MKHSFGLTLILTLFLGFVQSQTAGNAKERSIPSHECAYGCISLSSLGLSCPLPLSCVIMVHTFVSSLCIYSFLFKSKAITATTKTTSSTCAASDCTVTALRTLHLELNCSFESMQFKMNGTFLVLLATPGHYFCSTVHSLITLQ